MKAKLIGIPGSHPSRAAELMLRHKGLPYRRVDLPNQLQKLVLPLARYRSRTVPVLKLDGRKVAGSRAIARALDDLRPEPPLFPADPERRRLVEEAERWADQDFQGTARNLARWAAAHDPRGAATFAEGAQLLLPRPLLRVTLPVFVRVVVRTFRVTDEAARGLLERLPAELERADRLVGEGVIGGEQPNAADFQVATTVRLLLTLEQVRPALEGRPATQLALRLVPEYPGRLGAVFPERWLEPLRRAQARR